MTASRPSQVDVIAPVAMPDLRATAQRQQRYPPQANAVSAMVRRPYVQPLT